VGRQSIRTGTTNLVANPQVTVEIGTDRWVGTAHLIEGDERRRLFDAQAAQIPQLAEYEKNAAPREIPVFWITKN
jgi:deazaflavin-dependent oxidoreductase (nitroreductase family)